MPELILRTQGGFANRLRAIVSAVMWAEDLGRKLVIYWPVEPGHMPCALEDLLVPSSIPGLCCVHNGYISKGHQVLNEADMQAMIKLYGHTDEIRVESYAEFHPECRSVRGISLLRGIRIQPRIEEQADKLWKETSGQSCWTAIHFRGTDHKKCLAVSPLEAFVGRIGAEREENPEFRYILCSDEHSVAKIFEENFNIQAPVLVRGRRHPEQQILGVVDWLLLQKCQRILASTGSSFSELAALRSGGELVTLTQ
jgi:hypothetical protein